MTHHNPPINHIPLSHYTRPRLSINPHNFPIISHWPAPDQNCNLSGAHLSFKCLHQAGQTVICVEMIINLYDLYHFPHASPDRLSSPWDPPRERTLTGGTIKIWHDRNFYEYCIHTDEWSSLMDIQPRCSFILRNSFFSSIISNFPLNTREAVVRGGERCWVGGYIKSNWLTFILNPLTGIRKG